MSPLGGEEWAVEIALRGMDLAPGEETPDIQIGLHYGDWSAWDWSNDPSRSGNGTTFEKNENIVVLADPVGRVPATEDPNEPNPMGSLVVHGRDEGFGDMKELKPRLVFENTGSDAVREFEMRFAFTIDPGRTPVLASWYVPSCQGRLEDRGQGLWDAVYECRNLSILPGARWPDATGVVFGLHHQDWSAWNKSDDPSGKGLGATLQILPSVVTTVQR